VLGIPSRELDATPPASARSSTSSRRPREKKYVPEATTRREGARGEGLAGRAADLEAAVVAVARRDDVVGVAEGAAVAEVDRVAGVGLLVEHALLLQVPGEQPRRRRALEAEVVRRADRELARALVLDVLLARAGEEIVPDAPGRGGESKSRRRSWIFWSSFRALRKRQALSKMSWLL
jgi:hypothetical protein